MTAERATHRDQEPTRMDAETVKGLKARDNVTNWFHLGQIYFVIAGTIALAITADSLIATHGLAWQWTLFVNAVAILVIGAAQHQFGGAIHEGTHFMLFKDRLINELASDWLAAFPIYTSTHQFRLHHLAHHQFVNDPERDPDIAQLKESGHWLDFPVPSIELLWSLIKQLSPVQLIRFTITRAKYSAVGFDNHAYIDATQAASKWPLRAGIIFAVPVALVTTILVRHGYPAEGAFFLAAAWLITTGYILVFTTEKDYEGARLLPVISHRTTMLARVTYFGILYGVLTALHVTGITPAWDYYTLYWVLPLFTSFPLLMMLRQWVQHGNADRGRYTNTRVFLVGPLVRYAVFPWGMDYHLPHHMMASVPHYKLRALHEALLKDPEYQQKGVVVHGVFTGHATPSIVSSLGAAHAPKRQESAYVDNATLEYANLRDAASIEREATLSAQAPQHPVTP